MVEVPRRYEVPAGDHPIALLEICALEADPGDSRHWSSTAAGSVDWPHWRRRRSGMKTTHRGCDVRSPRCRRGARSWSVRCRASREMVTWSSPPMRRTEVAERSLFATRRDMCGPRCRAPSASGSISRRCAMAARRSGTAGPGVGGRARDGTGISATDRACTIAALGSAGVTGLGLPRPGHVVPVRPAADGVLDGRGPAEAAVDLACFGGRRRAARAVRNRVPPPSRLRWPAAPNWSNSPSNTDCPWCRSRSWWHSGADRTPGGPPGGDGPAHRAG